MSQTHRNINWKTVTQLFPMIIVRVDLSPPKTVDKAAKFLPKPLYNSFPLSIPVCVCSQRKETIVAYRECFSVLACVQKFFFSYV